MSSRGDGLAAFIDFGLGDCGSEPWLEVLCDKYKIDGSCPRKQLTIMGGHKDQSGAGMSAQTWKE